MTATRLDTAQVRQHNLSLVLRALLRLGPSARSTLAAETGLTRGALTSLAGELIEAGIVRESDAVPAEGMGRPRVLLELAAPHTAVLVGLLDADRATAVLAALDGTPLTRVERRHGRPLGDPHAVAHVLGAVVEEAANRAHELGRTVIDVSVVVWAPVGEDPPVVLADTDLEWGRVDIVSLLREASPAADALASALPDGIRLSADSSVAAVAEHAVAGHPRRMLYLKSDSGIGGALLVDGHLSMGTQGGAFGHIPVVAGGERCACGQRGCLVTVAGPDAVLAAAGLEALSREEGLAAALAELVRRIRDGNEQALAAWQPAAAEIARTLRILVFSFGADHVVLGGYLAELADDVAERFREELPLLARQVAGAVPAVTGSALGRDAALRGAIHTASLLLTDHPSRIPHSS